MLKVFLILRILSIRNNFRDFVCGAAMWQPRFPRVRRICINTAAVRVSAC